MTKKLKYFIHKTLLKLYRDNVIISKGVALNRSSILFGYNYLGDNTDVRDSVLGFGSYIASNSVVKKTIIGNYSAIGEHVMTYVGRHPTKKFVSIHPAFFSVSKSCGFSYVTRQKFNEHIYIDKNRKFVVDIGNDVWIANRVTISDGVRIGDGSIIGYGSFVTENTEPYSINVGVPSKKIGYRFEKKYIDFLLELKWWDKPHYWIRNNIDFFHDIDKLFEHNKDI